MNDRDESISKVIDVVDEDMAGENEFKIREVFELETGVKIRISRIKQHFITQVSKRFTPPKVPIFFNETKGREEENPNDPEYLEAMEDHIVDLGVAVNDAVLLRATTIEELPKGVHGPDSKYWKEEMEVLGMPAKNRRARYLAWLTGYAATDEEIRAMFEEIGRLSGVPEVDVQEAVKLFRDKQRGRSD